MPSPVTGLTPAYPQSPFPPWLIYTAEVTGTAVSWTMPEFLEHLRDELVPVLAPAVEKHGGRLAVWGSRLTIRGIATKEAVALFNVAISATLHALDYYVYVAWPESFWVNVMIDARSPESRFALKIESTAPGLGDEWFVNGWSRGGDLPATRPEPGILVVEHNLARPIQLLTGIVAWLQAGVAEYTATRTMHGHVALAVAIVAHD